MEDTPVAGATDGAYGFADEQAGGYYPQQQPQRASTLKIVGLTLAAAAAGTLAIKEKNLKVSLKETGQQF